MTFCPFAHSSSSSSPCICQAFPHSLVLCTSEPVQSSLTMLHTFTCNRTANKHQSTTSLHPITMETLNKSLRLDPTGCATICSAVIEYSKSHIFWWKMASSPFVWVAALSCCAPSPVAFPLPSSSVPSLLPPDAGNGGDVSNDMTLYWFADKIITTTED